MFSYFMNVTLIKQHCVAFLYLNKILDSITYYTTFQLSKPNVFGTNYIYYLLIT